MTIARRSGSPQGSPPFSPRESLRSPPSGPHQASRTWWAREARAITALSGSAASDVSSSPVKSRRSSSRACSAAAYFLVQPHSVRLVVQSGPGYAGPWRRVNGTGVGTGNTVVAWCRSPVAGTWLAGEGVLRPEPPGRHRPTTEHRPPHERRFNGLDFSTEPNFEEKLDGCVPSCARRSSRSRPSRSRTTRSGWSSDPTGTGQRAGPLGGPFAAELGGMGFGQVRLGLMHEILGQSPLPRGLRQQRTRFGQR